MNRIPMSNEISVVTAADLERQRRAESDRAAKMIEDRKRREAEQERARTEAAREQGRQALEAYEQQAMRAFLDSGGTAAEWPAAWAKLRQEYLLAQSRERMGAKERRVAAIRELMTGGAAPRL